MNRKSNSMKIEVKSQMRAKDDKKQRNLVLVKERANKKISNGRNGRKQQNRTKNERKQAHRSFYDSDVSQQHPTACCIFNSHSIILPPFLSLPPFLYPSFIPPLIHGLPKQMEIVRLGGPFQYDNLSL